METEVRHDTLVISELFHSIQGEGQTMGIPAIFIRLAGCNLFCEGAGWRCDTIEVWQKGKRTPFAAVLSDLHVTALRCGAHLIFTGGEPLLHQKAISRFIQWLISVYEFKPIVEIETNGTISPLAMMFSFIKYWNVSPKLSTSGEPAEKRINPEALETINTFGKKVIFKFVISCDADIQELFADFGNAYDINLPISRFVLMPAGSSQEQLALTRPFVAAKCIEYGIRYSERLHIGIWNQKTGV